jgi:hypothetical protein
MSSGKFLGMRSPHHSVPNPLTHIYREEHARSHGVVYPMPNSQARGSPLVGCTILLIQYFRSHPPYLEAVSSVRNLRTRHAVVTRDPLNMVCRLEQNEIE